MDILAAHLDLPSAIEASPAQAWHGDTWRGDTWRDDALPTGTPVPMPGRRAADPVQPPVAVVVVPVPPGRLQSLRAVLGSLARSRVAGNLPVMPGAMAVLVLAAEPEALGIAEALAPNYPFPLRVEAGPGDAVLAIRRAAAWASTLGAAGAPVLIADRGRPVEPRWAHGLLSALRDGADMVTRRSSLWERLLTGPVPPAALSGRAQWAMERWSSGSPSHRGAAWTERDSPWRRPAEAGLHAVTA
jgi:hypothetical protein